MKTQKASAKNEISLMRLKGRFLIHKCIATRIRFASTNKC